MNTAVPGLELPDPAKAFEFENSFYLTCDPTRIGKLLAHYELYRSVLDVPGAVVECGVFKGASLARFAMFRELLSTARSKKLIAFDTFAEFPETGFAEDLGPRDRFIADAGSRSISVEQMREVLRLKRCEEFVELVAGDICATVPKYCADHPATKISLLNLDTDVYEPAVTILEHLYPRLEVGGVLILDDYGVFPGETKAVDDFFRGRPVRIRKFPYCMTPCYIIKE